MSETENSSVLVQSFASQRNPGLRIGRITLNSPKSLNALTLEMIELTLAALEDWATDPSIVAVFLEGAGGKAFCAGGDVQKLYQAITGAREKGESPLPDCEKFFATEYKLDELIHKYPKPIVAWGHGFIMGGGLGLFAGASHRIVTEKSVIAMPEITIGLYPDVGGSYFLSKMPGKLGLFLALTGSRMRAADALYVNLADAFVPEERKDDVWFKLLNTDFEAKGTYFDKITQIVLSSANDPESSQLQKFRDTIDKTLIGESWQETLENFLAENFSEDQKYLIDAQNLLQKGSPTSAAIIFEQIRRSHNISLEDAFRQELTMSLQFCLHHDFAEGVRALLIAKDNSPQWSPATYDEVSDELIAEHFSQRGIK